MSICISLIDWRKLNNLAEMLTLLRGYEECNHPCFWLFEHFSAQYLLTFSDNFTEILTIQSPCTECQFPLARLKVIFSNFDLMFEISCHLCIAWSNLRKLRKLYFLKDTLYNFVSIRGQNNRYSKCSLMLSRKIFYKAET